MDKISIILAKLAGILKYIDNLKSTNSGRYSKAEGYHLFEQYEQLRTQLIEVYPDVFSHLLKRDPPPKWPGITDSDHYQMYTLNILKHDIESIFEIWANIKANKPKDKTDYKRIFISHGRSKDWYEVQAYIEKDLKISTLELAQEANMGRTIIQKLNEEANKCNFAVIVMTGDDLLGDDEKPRVRENVMHEIGFFQGKYGLGAISLLYEEGTNLPTNIHGVVYSGFPKGYIQASLSGLAREINAFYNT